MKLPYAIPGYNVSIILALLAIFIVSLFHQWSCSIGHGFRHKGSTGGLICRF